MRAALLIVVLVVSGCAQQAPPSLSPAGVQIWRANETVVALGTIQSIAIQLNGLQRCEPACVPLLSDRNTGIVVDAVTAALSVIKQAPSGWKPASLSALQQIEMRLDIAGKGKLAAYVTAARTIVEGL